MNWLVGITLIGVLLIAACGVWMNAASKSVEDTVEFTTRVVCYDSGFGDGAMEAPQLPPYSDAHCVEIYSDGYADARRDVYDPPQE